ncbi:TD and POZ domain-containing protein 5 [Trichonephila clavipes]|uniref:TD and POZ domain-containing protein 5 n=1 Tax=Trichonephila clavipes TaxID=2585209 RepID=A0A8X7BKI9_TRICX|nr:TD and POZ domain-containing protein 5 [Trichonephila clavipes]
MSFEVEYDIAILAEDGSVLHTSERGRMHPNNLWVSSVEFMPNILRVLFGETLKLRCRMRRTDGKAVKPITFFGRTVLRKYERSFLWDIERFSSLEPGQKVGFTNWTLVKEDGEEKITLNIQVNTEDKIMIFIDYSRKKNNYFNLRLSITDTSGSKVDCGKYEDTPYDLIYWKNAFHITFALPFTKQYLMQNQTLYLKNDVLSLYCECSWRSNIESYRTIERIYFGISSPYITGEVSAKPMFDLKKDLQCLHEEGILSDLKLRTTTHTFNAHKTILSARSPVFRAMFTTDMKEKIHACVDIPDLEDDTVHRMLLYMYTSALEDLQWESALKLYFAADKYQIATLKSKCCFFLQCNLRPNNLCDVLILADMHADGDLKEAALDFILTHEDFLRSEEWAEFAKNNATLAAEMIQLIWKRKN